MGWKIIAHDFCLKCDPLSENAFWLTEVLFSIPSDRKTICVLLQRLSSIYAHCAVNDFLQSPALAEETLRNKEYPNNYHFVLGHTHTRTLTQIMQNAPRCLFLTIICTNPDRAQPFWSEHIFVLQMFISGIWVSCRPAGERGPQPPFKSLNQ